MMTAMKKIFPFLFPIGFWAFLAGLQIRAALEPFNLIPILLALESGVIAYALLTRREEKRAAPWSQKWLAWLSVGLPLTLETGPTSIASQMVALTGIGLTLWGLMALGQSFGIAPADRGLVAVGPYRFIRHPMYAGAMLMATSALFQQAILWNLCVFSLLAASAVVRIRWEEETLHDYSFYARLVRWRLIPGVW